MTSRVTVEAICGINKHVRVVVLDDGVVETDDLLVNGAVEVYFVRDMKEIFIKEPTSN